MIYTVDRLVELLAALTAHHLEPKFLRLIHSRRNAPAKLCLVKVVKGANPGLLAGPPLVVYRAEGGHTGEVAAMLRP
jgi:tRNA1Val (adenine37-N6)-methyltransferase